MRPFPAVLLAALALGGCAVEPPRLEGVPPTPTSAGPEPAAVPGPAPAQNLTDGPNATIEAPAAWQVGQWWAYRNPNGEDTRVVSGDAGSNYVVSTSNPATAYFDALTDVSTLGPIRKADLAGSQRGQFIEIYRWPLAANTTWTTTWEGPKTITVVGPQVALVAGRSYPSMLLQASDADGLWARYNYVPAVGWFSFMEFLGPDGTFRLDLGDFGAGYNGTVVHARVQELYRDEGGGALRPQGSFSVPGSQTFLDIGLVARGSQVSYTITLAPPNNTALGPYTLGPCTGNCSFGESLVVPALAGSWSVVAAGTASGGAYAMVLVRAVEMVERAVR